VVPGWGRRHLAESRHCRLGKRCAMPFGRVTTDNLPSCCRLSTHVSHELCRETDRVVNTNLCVPDPCKWGQRHRLGKTNHSVCEAKGLLWQSRACPEHEISCSETLSHCLLSCACPCTIQRGQAKKNLRFSAFITGAS